MKSIVASILTATACAARADMPKVGDAAPDFQAVASSGATVKLKDYVGKNNIVLYFYPKDDTPGCTKEACGLRDTSEDLKGLNAVVFGVSFDSVELHRKFIAKYKLPFLLLADTDKKIALAYGVAAADSRFPTRAPFIIDKAGKIAYVNPKVSPATHAAEVRAALAGLKE
jgi:peroxiredoxin Q/BCP